MLLLYLGYFVLENYTWPLPRNDLEGMGGYTQPTWKKTKSTFKCIEKIDAFERKANFIENYFEFILH